MKKEYHFGFFIFKSFFTDSPVMSVVMAVYIFNRKYVVHRKIFQLENMFY